MSLAESFFENWCNVIEKRNDEVNQYWCKTKEYTNFIIHAENSVLMDVATLLGLRCYNSDYYYLDSVLYEESDYIKDFLHQCYLTNIRIAFEHENDFKSGLYQEVSHLLLINSELKVVVSYPPSESAEAAELKYLHGIISSSPIADNLSDRQGFLFIMGHVNPYRWVAWVYHKSEWRKLLTNGRNW
ncbi:MAG TPA: hypothetical protein VL995_19530 [Cellvibrio sp.]|nr:hypothetical protein [Cellvibrio sp.]